MIFEVKNEFIAREHQNRYYAAGDSYESDDEDRIKHLQKLGFLEGAPTGDLPECIKSLPRGMYELPNGKKVRGKNAALEAYKEIQVAGEV